jgi:hypothetical protein
MFPTIDNLTVDSITDVSAVISWTTDEPAVGSVSVELAEGTLTISDPTPRTEHSFPVSPLTGCTLYPYTATSADAAGNTTVADNGGLQHVFASFCPDPPTVPNGSNGSAPMRAALSSNRIRLFWDNDCVGTGPSKVLYGPLDDVANYSTFGAECDIEPDASLYQWSSVPSASVWFLLVEENGVGVEGSWGDATSGERNGLQHSGECGATSKIVAESCPNGPNE